jgi:xanthine dehydrogenase accessory factor
MRDILPHLVRWIDEGQAVAVGSVIERIGSAPRDPGAALAVSAAGEVAGSVTGGCVEPAVIREATEVLNGSPGRICRYGLTDDEGFDVGLSCGGTIAVAVYPLDPALLTPLGEAVENDAPVALTVRLAERGFGEQRLVSGEGAPSGDPIESAARSLLEIGESGVIETSAGELVFVESYAPRADLYLFGASDHVAALVKMGKLLGYRVTVCDPRTTFMTRDRFPDADELAIEWPDRFLENAPIDARTAICMLTHDLKFDVPALKRALQTNAGYIGAIGSEKTRTERDARLRDEGVGEADLARLHAPIGIQIGARTPEEVAVTIAAQVIEANVVARTKRIGSVARATVLS